MSVGMVHVYSQTPLPKPKKLSVQQDREKLKQTLDPQAYQVLCNEATEAPFSSPLLAIKDKGIYVCKACKAPLFQSQNKYDSGSGWPSFDRAIPGSVVYTTDRSLEPASSARALKRWKTPWAPPKRKRSWPGLRI